MVAPVDAPEISGSMTGVTVRYIRNAYGDDGVRRLLDLAGDPRPAEDLERTSSWTSYLHMLRLFAAAETITGDPDIARRIGAGDAATVRGWVERTSRSSQTQHLVEGTVDLAHRVGVAVVVEGVEEPEQLDFVKGLGADDMQGFLLGRPMLHDAVVARLTEEGARATS